MHSALTSTVGPSPQQLPLLRHFANSFRICTYEMSLSKSFRICTYEK